MLKIYYLCSEVENNHQNLSIKQKYLILKGFKSLFSCSFTTQNLSRGHYFKQC